MLCWPVNIGVIPQKITVSWENTPPAKTHPKRLMNIYLTVVGERFFSFEKGKICPSQLRHTANSVPVQPALSSNLLLWAKLMLSHLMP